MLRLALCLLCLRCDWSSGSPSALGHTPAPVTPRSDRACDGVRCKELADRDHPAALCGIWRGDTFWFQSACDMAWFSCMSERDYSVAPAEQCGERPPSPPTPTSTSARPAPQHTVTLSYPAPTLFSLTYPALPPITLPPSMPQFTFPTNPPPPSLPPISFPAMVNNPVAPIQSLLQLSFDPAQPAPGE